MGDAIRKGRVTAKMKNAGPVPKGVIVQLMKGKTTFLTEMHFCKGKGRRSGATCGGIQPARRW